MTLTRSFFSKLLLLTIVVGVLGGPATAEAAPSPTGRSPRLVWTPERQDVWNRMRADFMANQSNPQTLGGRWFKLVKDNAECGCRYGDNGIWATFMYQWTGDTRYVDLAWRKLSEQFLAQTAAQLGDNYAREYSIEYAIFLDWLWPGLTPQRREQLGNAVAAMLDHAIYGNQWVDGYRDGDSDHIIGTYFGALAFHLAFPENQLGRKVFNHPRTGGLTPTALDQTTARNAVGVYVRMLAEGGEWIESTMYNLNTQRLLIMGVEAVRTVTGVDHFPEVTQWLPKSAEALMAHWTPDFNGTQEWGDLEQGHGVSHWSWSNTMGMTAGVTQGTTQGAQLQQQLLDLVAKYGAVGSNGTMEPLVNGRIFYFFNPYAQTADWRTSRSFYAAGQGLLIQRSGFSPSDSLFSAHFGTRPKGLAVDHFVRYNGDFELWRNGEWVLTHPRSYQGAPNGGLGTNAVLMHGFSDMFGLKEVTAQSANNAYAFIQGTTGGASVEKQRYDPPPIFVHEWTRSLLYLPGSTDTVIVFDRAHVDTTVPRPDRYYPPEREMFTQATAPKEFVLHMPVMPTIGAANISWSTPKGQPVRWTPLLPANSRKTGYDETVLRAAGRFGGYMDASELKFHVRVAPPAAQPWDTFLNVIQFGTPGTVTLRSVTGQVEGAHVTRPGSADALALFNASPGARLEPAAWDPSHEEAVRRAHLRSTGFTTTWTAQGTSTEVYIADLDPGRTWTVRVDGGQVPNFSPNTGGFGRFTVTGSGSHTLTVTPTGQASLPPAAPTGLRIVP